MRRCSATPAHEPATMCCKKLTPLLLSNSSHSSCSSTASAKAEDEDFEEEDEWDILSKKKFCAEHYKKLIEVDCVTLFQKNRKMKFL